MNSDSLRPKTVSLFLELTKNNIRICFFRKRDYIITNFDSVYLTVARWQV